MTDHQKNLVTHRNARRLGLAALILLMPSCGKNNAASEGETEAATSRVVVISPDSSHQMTTIPISFVHSQDRSAHLALSATEADAWTIELDECLSGHKATVTEIDFDGLQVYRFDRNCVAMLKEFVFDGKTYVPTAADPFTTWSVGDIATFDEVGEPGISPLRLMVLSTLGSPVTGLETISYGWATINEGQGRNILWTTVGTSDRISVGENPAPAFTVKSIERTGISAGAGGQFRFVLECTSSIMNTSNCDGISFNDIDYKLVEDTFGGAIDQAQADSIFSTPGVMMSLPEDRVAPGDSNTINGGFRTLILDGPNDMANHPHMLLVLRSYEQSFQYFNIDVAVAPNY